MGFCVSFWENTSSKNVALTLGLLNAAVSFPMALVLMCENSNSADSAAFRGLFSLTLVLSGGAVASTVAWAGSNLYNKYFEDRGQYSLLPTYSSK